MVDANPTPSERLDAKENERAATDVFGEEDVDFGTFEDAQAPPTTETECTTTPPEVEGFGSFEGGSKTTEGTGLNVRSPIGPAVGTAGLSKVVSGEDPTTEKADEEDDPFGDFDGPSPTANVGEEGATDAATENDESGAMPSATANGVVSLDMTGDAPQSNDIVSSSRDLDQLSSFMTAATEESLEYSEVAEPAEKCGGDEAITTAVDDKPAELETSSPVKLEEKTGALENAVYDDAVGVGDHSGDEKGTSTQLEADEANVASSTGSEVTGCATNVDTEGPTTLTAGFAQTNVLNEPRTENDEDELGDFGGFGANTQCTEHTSQTSMESGVTEGAIQTGCDGPGKTNYKIEKENDGTVNEEHINVAATDEAESSAECKLNADYEDLGDFSDFHEASVGDNAVPLEHDDKMDEDVDDTSAPCTGQRAEEKRQDSESKIANSTAAKSVENGELTSAEDISHDNKDESVAPKPADVGVDKEDGFGDFADFQNSSSSPSDAYGKRDISDDKIQDAPTEAEIVDGGEKSEGTADFGSFENAPGISMAYEKAAAAPSGAEGETDEFRDFASFNEAAGAGGTLDTTAQSTPALSTELCQATQEKPQLDDGIKQEGSDDDFDDFGDFSSFHEASSTPVEASPPTESATEKQESTAAATFEATFEADFQESAPSPGAFDDDPFLKKASAIFQRIFSRCAPENSNDEPEKNGSDMALSPVSVATVLSSIEVEDMDDRTQLRSRKELSSLLSEVKMLGDAPPSVIVSDELPYPYAHYTMPFGGELPTFEDLKLDTSNKDEGGGGPSVPDVLSIDLPTGNDITTPEIPSERKTPSFGPTVVDFPLAQQNDNDKAVKPGVNEIESSKTSNSSKKKNSSLGPTVVELPPAGQNGSDKAVEPAGETGQMEEFEADFGDFASAAAEGASSENGAGPTSESGHSMTPDDALSEASKEFLAQIPDLSFMLQSTLCLPKNATEKET